MMQVGADRIDEYRELFADKRIGLITTPTGVLSNLTSTIDKFASDYDLIALYAPEHGVRGDQQDGAAVVSYIDGKTKIPVYSMYGAKRFPSIEELSDVDVLVYDVQDVGSRYYTFIYSMANSMAVAKEKGIPFVVLDRANPISGLYPMGTPMSDGCRSFIGLYDIPQRYALTCGELAMLFNEEENLGVSLQVVPLSCWQRSSFFDDFGSTWINPSPNIASFDACLLYNGTCLFEGTNISEGRGTTRPFELIGAPWIDASAYADVLNGRELPGVVFRPISFIPQFHKFKGEVCNGVQVHVTDKKQMNPLMVGLCMVYEAKRMYGDWFEFTKPRHEIGDFTMDLLVGSDKVRKGYDLKDIESIMMDYSQKYERYYKKYWMYQ